LSSRPTMPRGRFSARRLRSAYRNRPYARRRGGRRMSGAAGIAAREQIEEGAQAALHVRYPLAGVPADQLIERHVRSHKRGLILKPFAGAGKGEALDEQQMLDPDHSLYIRAPVDPRASGCLCDAKLGELSLPRSQHVRLNFDDVADLGG